MIYFYLYLILFLMAACFDIWVRRFFMFPIAIGAIGAIVLLLVNINPLAVMVIFAIAVGCMYIFRYFSKK